MPVGKDSPTDLMPTPEQREKLYLFNRQDRARQSRSSRWTSSTTASMSAVASLADAAICTSTLHGDVEPCVFIHYSEREHPRVNAARWRCVRPLFMAYHDEQPFNDNYMRPCPMLENPEKLRAMVKSSGAHSTDLQSPETVDHLCAKCDRYAAEWKPAADKLWAENRAEHDAK